METVAVSLFRRLRLGRDAEDAGAFRERDEAVGAEDVAGKADAAADLAAVG